MHDFKENSFDIQQAKALSHKLKQSRDASIQFNKPAKLPEYTRFTFQRPPSQIPQTPMPIVERKEHPIPVPPIEGFDGIESLLKWCYELSNANMVFVVDAEGFVLSSCGMSSEDQTEGAGAELSYALEQLDRISDEETELLSICLEYNTKHIYGFQAFGDDRERFILGISTNSPIEYRVKEALSKISTRMVPILS